MAFAATSQRQKRGKLKLTTLNATFLFCLLLQCQQMPQTGLSDLPVIIKLLLQL